MSAPPDMRRVDKAMPQADALDVIQRGFCGRLATIGEDGYPYCVPLLYVWMDGEIWLHNARAKGHLRANVEHCSKVCFEVDETGEVFPYGRFECDTTISFRSVIAFGAIRVVDDLDAKQKFFEALMDKYAKSDWERPKGFFPRIDAITLYALTIERMTGKNTPLPDVSERWPAKDRSMTPNARQTSQ